MLNLYTYSLPLHSIFKTGRGSMRVRRGAILRFSAPDIPADLASEAAPLPGHSDETLGQVVQILKTDQPVLTEFLHQVNTCQQLKEFLQARSYPPPVEFAVSCLALDLIALRKKDHSGISNKFVPANDITSLAVNAVIGRLPAEQTEAEVLKFYRLGYRTIKVKCGNDPGSLPEIIKKFSRRYPDLVFRIDANQSWPQDITLYNLELFDHPSIEYCEEPLSSGSLNDFVRLKDESPVPLALDESIRNLQDLRYAIKNKIADVVVIKPAFIGNILNLFETFASSDTHVGKRVFTSSFESSVGLRAVARATVLLGSREMAHGLDTGRFFKKNLSDWNVSGGVLDTGYAHSWSINFNHCDVQNLEKLVTG